MALALGAVASCGVSVIAVVEDVAVFVDGVMLVVFIFEGEGVFVDLFDGVGGVGVSFISITPVLLNA